jgi:hypothetical protein
MAKVSKAQMGKAVVKKKAAKDSVESEMNPGKMIPKSAITKGPYITTKKKEEAPKKKMKSGGELGMKSVKSGYDDNAGVTRADFVAMGKGEAKHGAKMMKMGGAAAKQAAIAIAMKKAGKTPKKKMNYGGKAASMAPKKAMGGMKMMKGGGKCKYGC